jgi:hypothetical protein
MAVLPKYTGRFGEIRTHVGADNLVVPQHRIGRMRFVQKVCNLEIQFDTSEHIRSRHAMEPSKSQ